MQEQTTVTTKAHAIRGLTVGVILVIIFGCVVANIIIKHNNFWNNAIQVNAVVTRVKPAYRTVSGYYAVTFTEQDGSGRATATRNHISRTGNDQTGRYDYCMVRPCRPATCPDK